MDRGLRTREFRQCPMERPSHSGSHIEPGRQVNLKLAESMKGSVQVKAGDGLLCLARLPRGNADQSRLCGRPGTCIYSGFPNAPRYLIAPSSEWGKWTMRLAAVHRHFRERQVGQHASAAAP